MSTMKNKGSKYYKSSCCGSLEALDVTDHNISFPFHFHPTFNITLVQEGIFQSRLKDRSVTAPSGAILITNPQEIHANPCERDSSVSFFTFYLADDFLQYCNNGRPLVFDQKVIYDEFLFDALQHSSAQLKQDPVHEKNFETQLGRALQQLMESYGTAPDKEEDVKLKALFNDFLKEDHLLRFSLQDAAKRFGIDKYKFLRLFKHQTGLTPGNYFIMRRIEKSKALLAEGQDLLSIALELDFYDAAHFCKHFKKFTGVSPLAYALGA